MVYHHTDRLKHILGFFLWPYYISVRTKCGGHEPRFGQCRERRWRSPLGLHYDFLNLLILLHLFLPFPHTHCWRGACHHSCVDDWQQKILVSVQQRLVHRSLFVPTSRKQATQLNEKSICLDTILYSMLKNNESMTSTGILNPDQLASPSLAQPSPAQPSLQLHAASSHSLILTTLLLVWESVPHTGRCRDQPATLN